MTDAISGNSPYPVNPYAATADSAGQGGRRSTILSAASSVLGIDPQTLAVDLRGGQSLADLAQQKGVSSDSLVSAIAQGIQATGGANAPDSTQATKLATDIVNRKGGGHHHHHGGSAKSADSADSTSDASSTSPFAALSSMLGMSETDLLSKLEQGSSLPDLLSESGLSAQGLGSALSPGSLVDTTA